MKHSEAVRKLNRFAKEHPDVADVIVNLASDLHTVKQEHRELLKMFAQLSEVIQVLMQQSKMYDGVLKALVERTGGKLKSSEEFSSIAVDDASERFKQ